MNEVHYVDNQDCIGESFSSAYIQILFNTSIRSLCGCFVDRNLIMLFSGANKTPHIWQMSPIKHLPVCFMWEGGGALTSTSQTLRSIIRAKRSIKTPVLWSRFPTERRLPVEPTRAKGCCKCNRRSPTWISILAPLLLLRARHQSS